MNIIEETWVDSFFLPFSQVLPLFFKYLVRKCLDNQTPPEARLFGNRRYLENYEV